PTSSMVIQKLGCGRDHPVCTVFSDMVRPAVYRLAALCLHRAGVQSIDYWQMGVELVCPPHLMAQLSYRPAGADQYRTCHQSCPGIADVWRCRCSENGSLHPDPY